MEDKFTNPDAWFGQFDIWWVLEGFSIIIFVIRWQACMVVFMSMIFSISLDLSMTTRTEKP